MGLFMAGLGRVGDQSYLGLRMLAWTVAVEETSTTDVGWNMVIR